MSIKVDIFAPDLPESVIDARVISWHKKIGDFVNRDDVLAEIETDKIILEVVAPSSGILSDIFKKKGSTVSKRALLGYLKICEQLVSDIKNNGEKNIFSPSARRTLLKKNLKEIEKKESNVLEKKILKNKVPSNEKRIPLTSLRKRIIERLLDTKNKTVSLTTFNEVNMQPIINLRKNYKEMFEKCHNIHLGFMSFYVKSVVAALKKYPEFNAYIDNEDIVYHNDYNINIAISTTRGLITPVLKQVNTMSMCDIEKKIRELIEKGNKNTLTIEELIGGNFTITNGGIFGSLMSTPIINPPQSGILGIHLIKDRPVVINKKILILPMMYIALSYDHRIVDGREAVGFLVMIKEILEDPTRLIFNI